MLEHRARAVLVFALIAACAQARGAVVGKIRCPEGDVELGIEETDTQIRHLCASIRSLGRKSLPLLKKAAVARLRAVDLEALIQRRIEVGVREAQKAIDAGIAYSSMDCSSFARAAYPELPRTAQEQHDYLSRHEGGGRQSLKARELRFGDLMFYGGEHSQKGVEHVMIYLGRDSKTLDFMHSSLPIDREGRIIHDGPHRASIHVNGNEGSRGLWGRKHFLGGGRIGPGGT